MEEATFLTKFAESVTIIHRRDEFRASKIMAERALSNPKIKVRWNAVVTEILDGGGKVGGVRLRDTVTGEESELDVTGVFVAIGHDPRSELFRGQVPLDENGYVVVEAPGTQVGRGRRVRGRRPGRPHLPAGDHRRGNRVCGGSGRRAVPGSQTA